MPTYDYVCNDCTETFEMFQSMNDDHAKECPKCTGTVKRVFSPGAGLIFKGSGFYITDYKKKEKEKVASEANAA